jgi:hypothetical protein
MGRMLAGLPEGHRAVEHVAVAGHARAIDRQLVEVGADPVAVGVGECPSERHLVGSESDAWHGVTWGERGLWIWANKLSRFLSSVIVPTLTSGKWLCGQILVRVGPVESVVLGIGLPPDLDRHRPAQELAAFDRLVRVAAVVVGVLTGDPVGFSAGQALCALVGDQ